VRDAVVRILSEADFGLFKNVGKTDASIQIFESELRQQAGELFVLDTLPSLQESKAKVPAYAPVKRKPTIWKKLVIGICHSLLAQSWTVKRLNCPKRMERRHSPASTAAPDT
jgi:hypothetical protein